MLTALPLWAYQGPWDCSANISFAAIFAKRMRGWWRKGAKFLGRPSYRATHYESEQGKSMDQVTNW
jgi:hypothetical protein